MCSSAQSDTGKVRAWNKVTPEKESGRCMLWIILSLWKFLVEIWKATEGSGISMFPGNWDQSRHQYGKLSCSSSQYCPGNTCICFSLVRPRSEEAVRDIFFPYRSFRSTIESQPQNTLCGNKIATMWRKRMSFRLPSLTIRLLWFTRAHSVAYNMIVGLDFDLVWFCFSLH